CDSGRGNPHATRDKVLDGAVVGKEDEGSTEVCVARESGVIEEKGWATAQKSEELEKSGWWSRNGGETKQRGKQQRKQ
ncbi:hypothetical protein PIB30_058941, partial [Stylosanthes scabra]|nr:hypothetical protein [Stylosanthes scabra]